MKSVSINLFLGYCLSGVLDSTGLMHSASVGNMRLVPVTSHSLASGSAFDNGCTCRRTCSGIYNNLIGIDTECHCRSPRLRAQLDFVQALMRIGKTLSALPTKELKGEIPLHNNTNCLVSGIT